jgi:hypothetical protein
MSCQVKTLPDHMIYTTETANLAMFYLLVDCSLWFLNKMDSKSPSKSNKKNATVTEEVKKKDHFLGRQVKGWKSNSSIPDLSMPLHKEPKQKS